MKVTLKIPDMSCMHCVTRINKTIEEVGAKGEINLDEKVAVVEFDEKRVSLNDIIESIKKAGYTVELGE